MINFDEPFPKNYTSMCREDQDAWREKHMVKPVSTSMTVTQDMLLDLLEECLPPLEFASGGTNCDETLGKVKFVLKLAGRNPKLYDSDQI